MAQSPNLHRRATDIPSGLPTTGDDFLLGTDEFDLIDGLAGNDSISGYGNGDVLYGRAGHDALYGGDGKDVLNGGADADYLEGGADADTFVYLKARDSVIVKLPGDPGHFTSPDIIADFNEAEGDRINLHRIDADTRRNGDQAFRFIGEREFTGRRGDMRLDAGETSSFLYGDTDGNTKADFVIELTGSFSSDDLSFYL
jgi:Ca2+-binding RTX toxin-like protein